MRRRSPVVPVPDLRDDARTFDPPLRFHEGMRQARRQVGLAGAWSSIVVPAAERVSLVAGDVLRIEVLGASAPLSEMGLRSLRRRCGLARDALVLPMEFAAPARGIALREHAGIVRAVVSRSYRAFEDVAVLDVVAHQVERASLTRCVFVAGVTTGSRTMLRLSAPIGSTGCSALADISTAHDGSEALLLRVRTFEPTRDGLIPEWRVAGRLVHRGDDWPARVETMAMRAVRVLAGPCLREEVENENGRNYTPHAPIKHPIASERCRRRFTLR